MVTVSKNDWSQAFDQIDSLLIKTREYWQISPFEHIDMPWLSNVALQSDLLLLTDDILDELESSDQKVRQYIEPFIGIKLDILENLPVITKPLKSVPSYFKAGIKGRKWSQISSFESMLPVNTSSILEWCAGKGHLGRLIGFQRQLPIISLEWQSNLCQQGNLLAKKHEVQQEFIEADAFSSTVSTLLDPSQHVVALHACGALHTTLLQRSSEQLVSGLTIVPCCYHLIAGQYYEPLSANAKKSKLRLSRQHLSLSMQQTVVAGNREVNHRVIEVAWRLGFDLLQRKIRQQDEYLPLPTIKQSLLSGSFEDFCVWACTIKGLTLNKDTVLNDYEEKGYQRQRINKRIELVTHAFRQLLERWLLLDRVIFMEEQGYDVALFNFCESSITPRNAMIQAIKKPI